MATGIVPLVHKPGRTRSSGSSSKPGRLRVRVWKWTNLAGSGMLSGFTGQLAGHLYGPAAEEIGGTLTGEDAAQVFNGFFGGDKQ